MNALIPFHSLREGMEAFLREPWVRKTLSQFDAQHEHRELNRRVRDGEALGPRYQKLHDQMRRVLRCSPRLSAARVLFRGISVRLAAQVDDVLGPWGFTWCTPDESLARRFTADTDDYYETHSSRRFWSTPEGPGTLLILHLPAGTSHMERHFDLRRHRLHVIEVLVSVKRWRVLERQEESPGGPVRLVITPVNKG